MSDSKEINSKETDPEETNRGESKSGDVSLMHNEFARLQTQMQALEEKYAQTQAKFALLLRTAYAYRDAHTAVKQDMQTLLLGKSLASSRRDETGADARIRTLSSTQAVLFAAIDMVDEEMGDEEMNAER